MAIPSYDQPLVNLLLIPIIQHLTIQSRGRHTKSKQVKTKERHKTVQFLQLSWGDAIRKATSERIEAPKNLTSIHSRRRHKKSNSENEKLHKIDQELRVGFYKFKSMVQGKPQKSYSSTTGEKINKNPSNLDMKWL